jgi:hypothetical protein
MTCIAGGVLDATEHFSKGRDLGTQSATLDQSNAHLKMGYQSLPLRV